MTLEQCPSCRYPFTSVTVMERRLNQRYTMLEFTCPNCARRQMIVENHIEHEKNDRQRT